MTFFGKMDFGDCWTLMPVITHMVIDF